KFHARPRAATVGACASNAPAAANDPGARGARRAPRWLLAPPSCGRGAEAPRVSSRLLGRRCACRSRSPARRRLLGLVDPREQLAGLDGLAGLDPHLGHRAGPRRADLVLHLHGLDDEEALTALDPGAWLDQDGDHLAGHRRPQLAGAVAGPGPLVAPPGALVEEAEAVGAARDGHLELVAPVGHADLGGGVVDQEGEGAGARLAAVDDALAPVDRDPIAPLA